MTDSEKTTAVLNYLDDCDGKTVVNILNSLISDEQFALLYDRLKEEGVDF